MVSVSTATVVNHTNHCSVSRRVHLWLALTSRYTTDNRQQGSDSERGTSFRVNKGRTVRQLAVRESEVAAPKKTKVIEKPAVAEVVQVAAPQPASSVEQIVRQAARNHGIDENYFVSIAMCESTMNPSAVNTNYYENGNPSGLFQHISGYWPARAAKYGYAGASVFNAEANANVTAAMWRDGARSLWEC